MSIAPCPFCGCAPGALLHLEVASGTWAMSCPRCYCIGPHADTDERTAQERWNDRPRTGLRATDQADVITLGDAL